MQFEVIVVGGGIGGLTTAALLAARGVSVCLFERQSQVGGCVAGVEHFGQRFEPTFGLYSGWEPGGTFHRIFDRLSADAPRVSKLSPSHVVRLSDGAEVSVSEDRAQFEENLHLAFPECGKAAVDFYRNLEPSKSGSVRESLSAQLTKCSSKFRRFVDAQLQLFLQCSADQCSNELAAAALDPQQAFYSIRGGGQALADSLAAAFKQHGGVLRLNSPVLRLAFGTDGAPIGIDLLNGERVVATKSIVSNLTVWDTYGKLIGPTRTPREVSSQLKELRSHGAYLLFLSMDRTAASHLISPRILALTGSQHSQSHDPVEGQLFFSVSDEPDQQANQDTVAVTVSTLANAEDWFTFHDDHRAHEERDQQMLETVWARLHSAMPELGNSVEVIETLTPQNYYETTRRRFGMVGRPYSISVTDAGLGPATVFPNLFIVSDTVSAGFGLQAVAQTALRLAEIL